VRQAGNRVVIVPRLSLTDGINAARIIFPNCWFDEDKCEDGLQVLRHYRYRVDQQTQQFSDQPVHAGADGADAFSYLALSLREKPERYNVPEKLRSLRESRHQLRGDVVFGSSARAQSADGTVLTQSADGTSGRPSPRRMSTLGWLR